MMEEAGRQERIQNNVLKVSDRMGYSSEGKVEYVDDGGMTTEKDVIAVKMCLSKGMDVLMDKVAVEKGDDENLVLSAIDLFADMKKGIKEEIIISDKIYGEVFSLGEDDFWWRWTVYGGWIESHEKRKEMEKKF
ncbi:hypothetical protein SUGI_0656550 [Cryptomeria japonica]|nr:hypothetical protein SUGI_0656550 [Cryptomeria japonica]